MAVFTRGQYLGFVGRLTTGAAYRLMLVTTGYTFDVNDNVVSDVTTNSVEIGVSGYARATVTISSLTEDDTNAMAFLDAADTTWGNLTAGATVGGAVAYIYSTSGGTSSDTGQDLVSYYSLTATPTNGGPITVQWASTSAGGFLALKTTS